MKVFLALLVSCAAVSASDALSDALPRIKGSNAKDAGAAYGFVFAQNHALDAITRRFSQLRAEGQTAHVIFDQKFGGAWTNVQLSWSVSTTNWLGMKQGIESTVSNSFDVGTLSVEDAKSFINEVRRRANGEMPASILATLLYFHPTYIERPEQEFMDGFRSRHTVESSDKSKAVSLQLDYPRSWVGEDSTRTGLLKRFVSQNGTGREMIILGITELPLSVIKSTSRQDVETYVASLQNELYLKEALPAGAKLKRWGKARLEGCSGYFQVYSLESQRLDLNLISEVVTYTVFFKNRMISVSCQTGDDISRRELVQKRFERLEKLFRLVANSLVIHSKWE